MEYSTTSQYRTDNKLPARYLGEITAKDEYRHVFAVTHPHDYEYWIRTNHAGGTFDGHLIHEVKPWEDWEIDRPIIVRDRETDGWKRGHFAGIDPISKHPRTFQFGTTQWTIQDVKSPSGELPTHSWNFVRLPTDYELQHNLRAPKRLHFCKKW